MKQSELFVKTLRDDPKDEVSVNAKLLIRAGFIDKLMSGVFTLLPLGFKVVKKIENIIREEMENLGAFEIFMPALHPKENWEATGRWDSMDDLYKISDKSGREFALGPTHEEIITPLVKKFIQSYRDLPFSAFQFQDKFRMELRAKSGILRGREFMMKDLYSFHLSEADLDSFYEKAVLAYKNIFARVGLGNLTHLTFASGGSFSKYSHEFQTVSEAGEDTIYVCEKCGSAVNKEIKDETSSCPECGASSFSEEKSIEVGNIFKLKDKFSGAFGLSVKNEKGDLEKVLMGCYGIGLGRLMGTIVEIYHDEKGIIWPESVAPFKAHLLSLGETDAALICEELKSAGHEVLFDDRSVSAGEKFSDADLIGLPYRLVKSAKTGDKIEVKKRNEEKSELLSVKEVISLLKK